MKKSRFFMLHPNTNSGKATRLDALLTEYVAYVQICVGTMLTGHTFNLPKKEKQIFFPPAQSLTSQIEKNARDHAISIVSGWGLSTYENKIKKIISNLKKLEEITNGQAKVLYTIGKYSKDKPDSHISQNDLDLYWTILLKSVKPPTITEKIGMRLSEMTSRLESPDETLLPDFWLRVSSLESRKSIWLPLVGNPYIKSPDQVSKGILAKKTLRGRWRFEVVEKRDWEVLTSVPDAPRIGIDVGLNVIVATSDGRLYGRDLKPKFDRFYAKVKKVRANRQRQDLKGDSPRLKILESRLSGLTKTAVGTATNRLVRDYPGCAFVIEDLDLSGCKGSKRFCYRALHHSLGMKALMVVVNPAYTSQKCPSCGYVSRNNRSGIKFHCRSCGRISHADVVGGMNLLGRSEDEQIHLDDHPSVVKRVLRGQYLRKRNSSLGSCQFAPTPIGQGFTVGGSGKPGICTASNSIPGFT